MPVKIFLFLLLLTPILSFSQSADHWKLYLGKKEVVSASNDSVQTINVKQHADTTLKFVFATNDTAFVRKVILMNEQRHGIDSKQVTAETHEVVFDTEQLYQQSGGANLCFYLVILPADPAKAALVRVAPRLILNLQWIE